jgi:hypothetical protein
MRGDEARIEQAFAKWLEADGWTVQRQVAFLDLVAERGAERMVAEVKGRTAAIGLDVDTSFGQLLRRMPEEDDNTRYALVVPTEARAAALRVSARIRAALRLRFYVVDEDGTVAVEGGDPANH